MSSGKNKRSLQRPDGISSATFLATPFDFDKIDELGIYHFDHKHQKTAEQIAKEKGFAEIASLLGAARPVASASPLAPSTAPIAEPKAAP